MRHTFFAASKIPRLVQESDAGNLTDHTRAGMTDVDEAVGAWSDPGENDAQSNGVPSASGARQHRSGTWMQQGRSSWMGGTSWWRKKGSVIPTGNSCLQAVCSLNGARCSDAFCT